MAEKDTFDEIALLVRARYALIVLDTREYDRAIAGAERIAAELGLHLFTWTRSRGMVRGVHSTDPVVEKSADPAKALAWILEQGAGLFVFRDLTAHFDDAAVISHMLDAIGHFNARRGAIILTGHNTSVPDALRQHATVLTLPAPSFDDYRQLLEAEKVITKLIVEDGALRETDVRRVTEAKRQVVEQDGLLEYYPSEGGMDQVAGLKGLAGRDEVRPGAVGRRNRRIQRRRDRGERRLRPLRRVRRRSSDDDGGCTGSGSRNATAVTDGW